MKKLIFAALGLAVMAAPLSAQQYSDQGGTILVQPERWTFVSNVQQELNRELNRIPYPDGIRDSGVVKVLFVANGEGRAENVRLFQDSGSHAMDRTAMRAVTRIDNLGPATSYGGERDVLLNIVFATSEREAERLVERVTAENAALIASGELEPHVLAITMSPSAPS